MTALSALSPSLLAPLARPAGMPSLAPAVAGAREAVGASRLGALHDRTVDLADQFLGDFAARLFGSEAGEIAISLDEFSLQAEASVGASAWAAAGPQGASTGMAMAARQAGAMSGSGTITTADGRRFAFSFDVSWETSMAASMSSATSNAMAADDPAVSLPSLAAPANGAGMDLQFGGTAADLLRLFRGEEGGPALTLDALLPKGGQQLRMVMRLLDQLTDQLADPADAPADGQAGDAPMRQALQKAYGPPADNVLTAAA